MARRSEGCEGGSGPPLAPRALRRRTAWHRGWGLCVALLGAAVVLLGAVAVAAVPSLLQDEKAYGAAGACAAGAPPGEDCVRAYEATVTRTVIKDQVKAEEYTLHLKGPAPVPDDIDMGDAEPLLKVLRPGDGVTVAMWRDYAVEVRKGSIVQETADTPVDEPQFAGAVGLVLLTGGAYGAYAGGTALFRARRWAVKGLPVVLLTRGKMALWAALAVIPALFAAAFSHVLVMFVVWLGLLPLARWGVLRQERRGAGRHARPHASPSAG